MNEATCSTVGPHTEHGTAVKCSGARNGVAMAADGTLAGETAPAPADPRAWTWEKRANSIDGATEFYGSSQYRAATVTNPGPGWQACMSSTEAYSPRSGYYASPASAKAWAERYGRPGRHRKS